jgi:hypothetical protein
MIRLQGKLRDFYLMEVMLIRLEVTCKVKALRPTSESVSFEVAQGAPGVTYQIQDFAQRPECGKSVRYEIAGSGVDLASYVRYEEVLDKIMGTIQRRVVMRAPVDADVSEVLFKIAAYVGDEEVPSGVQDVKLKVKKA